MLYNSVAVEAAATGFQALYLAGRAKAAPLYKPFCMVIESNKLIETFEIPDGVGDLREWLGERNFETPIRWSQSIRNKDWEGTIVVPRNAFADDSLGVYKSQAEMLGISAETHPDKLLFDTLSAGFTGNSYDAVDFFSASHPIEGTTQSNLVSGALAAATFRTALSQLQGMKDYKGKPIRTRAMGMKNYLMVGPSNRATADSIVTIPTTSSGAGNPDYKQAEVVINEYLTGDYANYWFLLAGDGPVAPLILQIRQKPEFISITDPANAEMLNRKRVVFGVEGRWNMGYGFYQLAQGSTGA